jgi:tricorn protease
MLPFFRITFFRSAAPALFAAVILLAAAAINCPADGAAAGSLKSNPTEMLLRFPDIHENMIVFVSGEDIWTAPASGGVARRLTIHDGEERYPKFSPDGSMIAFTGEYDGNGDVYVMNAHGGGITRVTWHPSFDQVIGWHPVSNKIIFSSARRSFNRFRRLYLINPDGSGLEELIMHEAEQGSFSPDGGKIAYNRISRENRTWKRYKGGTAQEIYIFDFNKMADSKITDFKGTDRIPMWIGDRIYFSSDRDRVLNIWSIDPATGETEQLTNHTEYDVRRPSEGTGSIVYELGGDIWRLDIESGRTAKVDIDVNSDAPELRPYIREVDRFITDVDISPSGKRALVSARGDVFTVPLEHGPTRNLTGSSGSREKDAVWSPDGSKIAYFSDSSGEYEIWIRGMGLDGEAKKLTSHKDGFRHTLRWSPDSKKLAYADQALHCWWIDVDSGKKTKVDRAEFENIDVSLELKPIYDFAWSPDSRWIAYSKMNADQVYQVYIYSLDSGKTQCVSNGIYNDFNPVFSKEGDHLFFISNRRFSPTFCDFEWEMVYKKVAGIYALTLRGDGEALFPPRSDEEKIDGESKKKNGGDKAEKDDGNGDEKLVNIDFDGIAGRIEALPLPRANYRQLATAEGSLFYLNKDEGDFNRFEFRAIGPMDLYRFSLEEREEEKVIAGIERYALSADGKSIVYTRDHDIGIIKSSEKDSKGNNLSTSGLKMKLDPLSEWKQIFAEAWRMERDFYYEPDMHGLDWDKMGEKYGRLIDRATCRQDVRYIIGELIGELNTSHTYVFGGDIRRDADRVSVGLLGVDWMLDDKSGLYRFGKILDVPDWSRGIIPPLSRPGVDVAEGDYLLEVNGVDVKTDRNINSYFEDLAGRQVTILVNGKPTKEGARKYTVEPARSEYLMRYHSWVEHNRKLVDEKSGGKIGYLHLPDTYLGSATEFPKLFYAQTRKKGMIVDGRFNGGGLDPAIFLQRLKKEILAYWTRRYSHDQTDPAVVMNAHLVCLTNRQAGSGGDMLPMEFQMMKMGPVIGTRTWGGLVGVSMWIGLIDGGGMSAPDYRIYDPEGRWIVENEGVTPDIEIDLDPVEMSKGDDAQLLKGIEVLMNNIKEDPKPWPKHEKFKIDR